MKSLVAFFEIPAADFDRAVQFYQSVLGIRLNTMDCGNEKMAFFPEENGLYPGAISYATGFNPSKEGVLISLSVESIEEALKAVVQNGGQVGIPKTKIEAEGRGWFATFTDSEGNTLGLYAEE